MLSVTFVRDTCILRYRHGAATLQHARTPRRRRAPASQNSTSRTCRATPHPSICRGGNSGSSSLPRPGRAPQRAIADQSVPPSSFTTAAAAFVRIPFRCAKPLMRLRWRCVRAAEIGMEEEPALLCRAATATAAAVWRRKLMMTSNGVREHHHHHQNLMPDQITRSYSYYTDSTVRCH
jgi:hypothetical protein